MKLQSVPSACKVFKLTVALQVLLNLDAGELTLPDLSGKQIQRRLLACDKKTAPTVQPACLPTARHVKKLLINSGFEMPFPRFYVFFEL